MMCRHGGKRREMSDNSYGSASAAEARFELWRRRGGIVLAPLASVVAAGASAGLPDPAHRLAAILAAVVVLWVSEALPMAITAFLGVAAAVVFQVAPASEAFAPFADPLIFLFIGTFMLAQAIYVHRLDRRFAFAILGWRLVGERPGRIVAAYAAVAGCLSMWISNTATTAMMLPIGISVLRLLEQRGQAPGGSQSTLGPGFGAALMLSNAFASSIGGLATPVGTPPNLIGIGFIRREAGFDLPFFSWMLIAMPVAVALFGFAVFDLLRRARGRPPRLGGLNDLVAAERSRMGPWTRGQVNTAIAFSVTVFLWILPGLVALVAGQDAPLVRQFSQILPESVVALLGAGLLFLLPTDLSRHEFTLSWGEAVKIDWWIVFLYGGGIALGTLAFRTGLADAMGRGLSEWSGVDSQLGLIAMSTALATLLSETTSNTASANMVVPVVIAIARSIGVDPVLPSVAASMGASLGFMLPVSTPCNALVYASGRVPLTRMIRHGVLLDLVGIAVIVTVISTIGPLVIGGR